MQRLQNPLPLFLDQRGALLDAGKIYIGTSGADPEVAPVDVFWDAALTIAAAQPLRTRGGVIVNNGSPAIVYIAVADYSMRVRDADDAQVSFIPSSVETGGVNYQPLDADLTAIAALATAPYGRALLTLANQAALKAAIGIPDPLPAAGGTVTGDITRQAAGVYLYHEDAAMVSGRVFVTVDTDPDPTSLVGDIWIKVSP